MNPRIEKMAQALVPSDKFTQLRAVAIERAEKSLQALTNDDLKAELEARGEMNRGKIIEAFKVALTDRTEPRYGDWELVDGEYEMLTDVVLGLYRRTDKGETP